MSFLAGRLAGVEGAYFLQESKHAVGRLAQKIKPNLPSPSSESPPIAIEAQSDVLPEVLRHSLPSKIFQPPSESSLSSASKWVLHSDLKNASSVSRDALNPLRAYVSLPQVTFGPKRWQLPNTDSSVLASTANELRRDKYTPVNPEKLKAAAVGLSQKEEAANYETWQAQTSKHNIRFPAMLEVSKTKAFFAKAFAVATAVVFGSATLMVGLAVSKLELHSGDDIKAKGKDLVQPKLEMFKEQLIPLKNWAGDTSKKWHLERGEDIKEKPLIKELSRIMGAKTPN